MKKFIPLLLVILICTLLTGCTKPKEVIKVVEKETTKEDTSKDKDQTITNYVENEAEKIDKLVEETNSNENKSKLKDAFITLTDFIFYDGTIKGVKFKDLQEASKKKVLDLWYKLDSKIDEKYPEQSEEIKNSANYSYNAIKSKATNLKEKLVNEYKDKVGEDTYNNQTEKVEEAKEKAKEKVKEKSQSVKEKVSNWYKNFKEGE